MCKDLTILCQTYDALYIKHFPVSILFTSTFQDT